MIFYFNNVIANVTKAGSNSASGFNGQCKNRQLRYINTPTKQSRLPPAKAYANVTLIIITGAAKRRSLTISLYASLLNLGVSLIVPMNTKKRPSAKERATMVIVLGEAIFCKVSLRLASVVPLQLSSLSC